MRACLTGATGFLGAHVARLLRARGDDVRVTYRRATGTGHLRRLGVEPVRADVLDYGALRRPLRGVDVLFHAAGHVGSSPVDRVWRINAHSPVVAVEAAAAEGVPRVVLTSTISAIGPASDGPADEYRKYPEDWLGLTYSDSKREGERAAFEAGERHGVEVVAVNPSYLLGVPADGSGQRESSTRIVGSYLRGRLPAVVDSEINVADVEDAARGHLLAAERGTPGERYILGGENLTWPRLVDRIATISHVHQPIVVLPRQVARVARIGEAIGLPRPLSAEGFELMSKDWRFSSRRAERELGYRRRPLDETLEATVAWYRRLIAEGRFDGDRPSIRSLMAAATRRVDQAGLLIPIRIGQLFARRRVLAGL